MGFLRNEKEAMGKVTMLIVSVGKPVNQLRIIRFPLPIRQKENSTDRMSRGLTKKGGLTKVLIY